MERTAIAAAIVLCLGFPAAHASDAKFDTDAECQAISEVDLTGCRCRGLYFESKFGPDAGVAALHLVGRSYVSEPRVTAASLYERFGAARLDDVAQKILQTRNEVAFYCPFSTNHAD
ncbi:hypothetical protein [Microvirga splendida]|uniref:Rap1a immunity protein domain-containing protein n=1 Tax=Microvirga splendida TaxID=2795727 RepID=A0ABS0XW91_9HYPH|nr:hypothetical protein [Microvirga splendida]MBJ6124319.1 hypothetical protein [Microvirga splendida]